MIFMLVVFDPAGECNKSVLGLSKVVSSYYFLRRIGVSLKKVLFICLTLSLMDAVVMAGDGEKKCKSGRLEAKDTNQDGSLSLDEILAGCPEEKAEKKKQWFAKLDANNDGLVSKEEMKGHCKERKEKKEKKED